MLHLLYSLLPMPRPAQPPAETPAAPASAAAAGIIAAVRLVAGPSNTRGLLEVQVNGTWGTVCSEGFTSWDTDTVCRQLGTPHGGYVDTCPECGPGTPLLAGGVVCGADDASLESCGYVAIDALGTEVAGGGNGNGTATATGSTLCQRFAVALGETWAVVITCHDARRGYNGQGSHTSTIVGGVMAVLVAIMAGALRTVGACRAGLMRKAWAGGP